MNPLLYRPAFNNQPQGSLSGLIRKKILIQNDAQYAHICWSGTFPSHGPPVEVRMDGFCKSSSIVTPFFASPCPCSCLPPL